MKLADEEKAVIHPKDERRGEPVRGEGGESILAS
jgi:hypothetical protein